MKWNEWRKTHTYTKINQKILQICKEIKTVKKKRERKRENKRRRNEKREGSRKRETIDVKFFNNNLGCHK